MPTEIDYQGRTVPGAAPALPPKWVEARTSDTGTFVFYKCGTGDLYAIVEFDHQAGGWVWRLHTWSPVEVAGNRFGQPCEKAIQAIRAVRRAAKKHGVGSEF
ncbi:hypothetical protein [Streptomyces sp. NPDC007063]|uniref:hypothetical protein n=1 Tax=Streptomyces sp. NPDC007063 TaxID=3364772 RepID=UPI00368E8901